MKRLWAHKWLIVVGALVIFLSVGAVAWAATGSDEGASDRATGAVGEVQASLTGNGDRDTTPGRGPLQERRQALEERRERRVERLLALLDHLRDEMSKEDRAACQGLLDDLKGQQEALQQARRQLEEARQDVAGTLEEMRQLVAKYLPVGEGDSD